MPMQFPWSERNGRLSPVKLVVFLALFAPGLWVAGAYDLGALGPRPLTEAIHQCGLWTIRLIFLSLALTPARRSFQWPRLILVRRMVGVAAFCYVCAHFLLYAADQDFALATVASEIARRIYLTIGFVALAGLGILAATSTDGMVRRLGGRRWRQLHQVVYAIAILALVHFYKQSKLDLFEPMWMTGLYLWLMGHRAIAWLGRDGAVPLWSLLPLSLAAASLIALAEASYVHFAMQAPLGLVLAANFSLEAGIRPAWIVLGAGLAVTAAAALRATLARLRRKVGRLAPRGPVSRLGSGADR